MEERAEGSSRHGGVGTCGQIIQGACSKKAARGIGVWQERKEGLFFKKEAKRFYLFRPSERLDYDHYDGDDHQKSGDLIGDTEEFL
jgi:hypothetical protein